MGKGTTMSSERAPTLDPKAPLAKLWTSPVSELVRLDDPREFTPEEREKYRIHALLVMALVDLHWNGNKRRSMAREEGVYPWRAGQRLANDIYDGGDYLGHNICCIAVDRYGDIIDFDFNHNEVFNSSVEHAESRLVRRVFSLSQISDLSWRTKSAEEAEADNYYTTTLSQVTIFTSLESCAQCAGIMALGSVKEVVYLQRDPGMYMIGNILRRLTTEGLRAPLPISGSEFGFAYTERLNAGFERFYREVETRPFFEGHKKNGTPYIDKSKSITSFLCTDDARAIFHAARLEFEALDEGSIAGKTPTTEGALSNAEILTRAKQFLTYARRTGRRGTPHR
jgi:tRNA(Arg) A34 adenosine deaminase TadA